MSKRLYLISNAHLDPVWQWEWEEGAAETLSTFKIAADFCEKYDNFVFCHNEAILYRWIEEYNMDLFERIKKLVKQGKWKIMGGWYLQPDCNMPSGEAFVRQILEGRKYFLEKFGVVPKIAVNLDPFGHTRGLVQIMAKCGYEGYLFMRPASGDRFIKLPSDEFIWKGYDGSSVKAVRICGGYNSNKGHAAEKAAEYAEKCGEDDIFLCLWGIGNHGGGPSEKDIDDLEALSADLKKEGTSVIHSYPEEYFEEMGKMHELPIYEKSLNNWSVGCYTSQITVKQKYRQAENDFIMAEMMSSHASMNKLMEYPYDELDEAKRDILFVQFHDMLPGSSVEPAEKMAVRTLDHSLEILSRIKARALFALAGGQKKIPEDKIPIFIYNPYPYAVKGDYVCEFMLWDQNWVDPYLECAVYDENGNVCPSQCEKENSTIPIQWRKRVAFHAELKPMSLNRFECGFTAMEKKPIPMLEHTTSHYIFKNGNIHVEINRKTGLIDKYEIDNVDCLNSNSFALEVYDDDYDPWGMERTAWKNKVGEFKLLNSVQAKEMCHTDKELEPVHIIERGAVRVIAEALFGYKDNRAAVRYYLSENSRDIEVDIKVIWNEKEKLIKLNVPTAVNPVECIGEQAYGRELLKAGMEENVSQKYVLLQSDSRAVAVINNGTYGSSFDEKTGALKLTLMRSPSYTAHPLPGRITMPQDRFMPYIDQGERNFSFKIYGGEKDEVLSRVSRKAQIFNMRPMALSFYPTCSGEKGSSPIRLSDDTINLTAFKTADDKNGYIVRIFNPTDEKRKTVLEFDGRSVPAELSPFEIKTYRYSGNKLTESDLTEGLLKNDGGRGHEH